MLHLIAALIPLYILWRLITMPFRAEDGDEALGNIIGLVLVFGFFSWLIG